MSTSRVARRPAPLEASAEFKHLLVNAVCNVAEGPESSDDERREIPASGRGRSRKKERARGRGAGVGEAADRQRKRPLSEAADQLQEQDRTLPNTEKKKSCKFEDVDWVEAQKRSEATQKEARDSSTGSTLNIILRDWTIHCSAEEWIAKHQVVAEDDDRKSEQVAVLQSSPLLCMSRIWGGGWSGQCTVRRLPGSEYCEAHDKQLQRQSYLTHGRIDGPIPPKKKKEFEKWQAKLKNHQTASESPHRHTSAMASEGSKTLTDGRSFDESSWRSMRQGAGESCRAYLYRTGNVLKKPSGQVQ